MGEFRLYKYAENDMLVSRTLGKKVLTEMIKYCSETSDRVGHIRISFEDIEVCDITFLDVAILGFQKHLKENTTDIIVFYEHISDNVLENLNAVIAYKKQITGKVVPILYFKDNEYQVAGPVPRHLKETFLLVKSKLVSNATDLVYIKKIAVNDASNRLKNLYAGRLVLRKLVYGHGSPYQYFLPVFKK